MAPIRNTEEKECNTERRAMFVDCSGLESYTDINTSFGKLVNTYYCFAACDCVDEQLGILKSLVPAYYEVAALTNTDFVSGRAGGITQKLLAMAMTLRQVADCLALIERCDSVVPVEVANPTSFKGSVMTLPLSRAYARLLDDWSYYMRRQQQQQPMAGRTGWVGGLQHRLPWRRSRTVVIPMLYIGGTAESARDLGSVLRDCEVRHTGETPLQLLWTSSPELTYARTPCWTSAIVACTTGRATSSTSATQPRTIACLEGASVSAWCNWRRYWARWPPRTRCSSGKRDFNFIFFF
ncbi:uncharacterized protein DI49_2975 [Saccharomyces eubayanus]|uniref:uncharacterized protein n=1 Tax=Saccharomyces eubayanus TaxID=1080349 RepID=UPI0006C4B1F6|nr:hypothetical protein DI49_2975 [Saccharomyces eubayanus]KOG98562.1 hypothetical protein DI49_2975 [Saccharomyces eubayanus]